jgi:hypothetical protein
MKARTLNTLLAVLIGTGLAGPSFAEVPSWLDVEPYEPYITQVLEETRAAGGMIGTSLTEDLAPVRSSKAAGSTAPCREIPGWLDEEFK